MLAKFKTLDDETIFINPLTVETIMRDDRGSCISFVSSQYSDVIVKGDVEAVASTINKRLETFMIKHVENLTIN